MPLLVTKTLHKELFLMTSNPIGTEKGLISLTGRYDEILTEYGFRTHVDMTSLAWERFVAIERKDLRQQQTIERRMRTILDACRKGLLGLQPKMDIIFRFIGPTHGQRYWRQHLLKARFGWSTQKGPTMTLTCVHE